MKFIHEVFITVVVCMIIGWGIVANAKDAELVIDFEMDADYAQFITEYRLLVERVPGSGTVEVVAVMPVVDTAVREWQTEVFDIPPGKELAWYLYSVDADGDVGESPAYLYKLIGKPVIINMRRIK